MRLLLALVVFTASVSAQSWRLILPKQAFTMQVNPQDPQKLIVGNWANQMLRSDDGGLTWETKELGSTSVVSYVTSLHWSSADTNVIVGAGFVFAGIKRSTDGGTTWEHVLLDTNQNRMWYISDAVIEDPSNPSTLYAARGTTYNTIYRSSDVGATWDSISVIDPTLTGRLCTITARPDSTNILYVGAQGGLMFRSDDAGLNWRQVPVLDTALKIAPDAEIPKIVFSRRDPMTGYAVVAIGSILYQPNSGGVLKTTDGGASWYRTGFSDTSFWAVDSRPTPDGLHDDVFAGGFRLALIPTDLKGDSLVFRSTDGGQSWTQFTTIDWQPNEIGQTLANVWMMRWDPVGEKMYMATQLGLYVLDESTTVQDVLHPSSLLVEQTGTSVLIVDSTPSPNVRWAIYGMDGQRWMEGDASATGQASIATSPLPNGRYVITWETDRSVRTVNLSVVR